MKESFPPSPEDTQPLEPIEESKDDDDITAADLLDLTEHELIQKYQPKYLAAGGQHIVYEIPNHPDIVVKVDSHHMKAILEQNVAHNRPLDTLSPALKQWLNKIVRMQRAQERAQRKIFGASNVLRTYSTVAKVPVTQEMISELYGPTKESPARQAPDWIKNVDEAWSIVRVEKRAHELSKDNDLERLPLNFYMEDLSHVLEIARRDESLREVLIDFTKKIGKYVKETGEILDFHEDNVTLFKENGRWRYRLVDAAYPDYEGTFWAVYHEARTKEDLGQPLTEEEESIVTAERDFRRFKERLEKEFNLGSYKLHPRLPPAGPNDVTADIEPE